MMTGQQQLINTLLPLAMNSGRSPAAAPDATQTLNNLFEQVKLMKEMGMFEQPQTGRTAYDLVMEAFAQVGGVVQSFAPIIMAKLGIKVPDSAPAPAPVPSDFTMAGLNAALTGQSSPQTKQITPGAVPGPDVAPVKTVTKIRPITPEAMISLNSEAK
jgi:hypothetical protein